MSEKTWETLTEEEQSALTEAAKEAQDWEIAEQRKLTDSYVEKMKDEGVEVIELTPDEIAEFQSYGMKVWDELYDVYGKERIEQLKKEVEEVKNLQ